MSLIKRNPITIHRLSNIEGMLRLREQWNVLHDGTEDSSVFTTFDWVKAWYRNYGYRGRPFVLYAHDGIRPLGIAPFCIWKGSYGNVPLRRIDFAGHNFGVSDFLIPERKPEIIDAFMDYLQKFQADWDMLVLKGPAKNSETSQILQRWFADKKYEFRVDPLRLHLVHLSGTWDDYLAEKGRNLRRQLIRAERKAEAFGKVEFRMEQKISDDRLEEAMEQVISISLRSWKGKTGSAIGSNEHVTQFYKQVAIDFNQAGRLDLGILSVGGKTIAYLFGLSVRNDYYQIDTAFDKAYEEASPGTLLNLLTLRELFHRGYRLCVSEGDHPYKSRWATDEMEISEISVFSRSLRSHVSRFIKSRVLPVMRHFLNWRRRIEEGFRGTSYRLEKASNEPGLNC